MSAPNTSSVSWFGRVAIVACWFAASMAVWFLGFLAIGAATALDTLDAMVRAALLAGIVGGTVATVAVRRTLAWSGWRSAPWCLLLTLAAAAAAWFLMPSSSVYSYV